jgi:hypothetical protein
MKRSQSYIDDIDDDGGGDSIDKCTDHEPASKKPKQQQQQDAYTVADAQTQVMECDDLLCLIMTVRDIYTHCMLSLCSLIIFVLFFVQFMSADSKIRRLPLVNKAWNRACQSQASWHSIRPWGYPSRLVTGVVDNLTLCKLMPRLSHLAVLWCETKLSDSFLSSMLEVCGPRLLELKWESTDGQLLTVVKSAPNLRSIYVDYRTSAHAVATALCFLRQLRCIHAGSINMLYGLYEIGSSCPFLETYIGLVDDQLLASLSSCGNLTNVDMYSHKTDVTAALVGFITRVGHNLRSVDFPLCDGSVVLPLVARLCRNLTKICGTHVCQVTDALIEDVLSSCGSTLKEVDLMKGCTDTSLVSVATHCPHITNLSLRFKNTITDDGVAALIASCPHLHQLDIGWTKLGGATLSAMAKHSALRYVFVSRRWTDQEEDDVVARRIELGLRNISIEYV